MWWILTLTTLLLVKQVNLVVSRSLPFAFSGPAPVLRIQKESSEQAKRESSFNNVY